MADDSQRLDYEQAASRLGVSEERLRELRTDRRIRDYPGYQGWAFKAEEVDALAAELAREQVATAEAAAAAAAAADHGPEIVEKPAAAPPELDGDQQSSDSTTLREEQESSVEDGSRLLEEAVRPAAAADPPASVEPTVSPPPPVRPPPRPPEASPVSGSEKPLPTPVEEFTSSEFRKEEKREWKAWRRKWIKQCPVDRRGQFGHYININFRKNFRTVSGDIVKLFEHRYPHTHSSRSQKRPRLRPNSGSGCVSVVLFLMVCLVGLLVLIGSRPVWAAEPSQRHWSFQPIRRPVVPGGTAVHPVDRFLDRKLQRARLTAAPSASRSTLVRRLSLDVVGLLPRPDRVEAFLDDERPDAWERLVDELLASPHFGERWGRHWLDLARYADSSGYESDRPRQIWPYRDWVIGAFNADMPFDRFVTEQLAGDLLPGATTSQKIATGFHCNAMLDGGVRWEAVIDRVQTTGSVFLGLTLGCAQCHAHKTDPVSQREFYELYAFFNEATIDRLALPGFDAGYRDGTVKPVTPNEKSSAEPTGPATLILKAAPQPTHMFLQGDPHQPGDKVEPGFPSFLSVGWSRRESAVNRRLSRLDLARWVVSDENPLTDRVTVNRVWQRLFGAGLVETENDFGVQTPPPSHPALLDFLVAEFRHGDHSLKRLIRLLVTSTGYRRSSEWLPLRERVDSRNRLVGRQKRLRLEAEIVRDVWLSAAGLLSSRMNGPSVFPRQPAGILDARATPAKWTISTGENLYRRGLYTWTWRLTPHPLLPLFDAPDGVTACTRRDRSNVPVQALALLNDPAFVECSQALGNRLASDPAAGDVERIERAYMTCFSRAASQEEVRLVRSLLDDQRESLGKDIDECRQLVGAKGMSSSRPVALVDRAAWVVVARVLMNLDEFITRE